MRRFLQFAGKILYFCAWPAYQVYLRVSPGRTRVVLVYGGKVLVMKQWLSDGTWSLPGGGLHKDEDPAEGAAREVLEETGVEVRSDRLWPLGKAKHRRYGLHFEYHMFASAVSSPKVRAQWYEVAELAWVRPEELNKANASPDTLKTIRAVRQKTSLVQ